MTRVQGIGRGKVKRVESCEARLDQRLDCHQGAQGTIVAGWDNSVSGLKLEAMSYEKVLCRYASSRCCYGPSGRVQCHGRAVTARGETMGIGRQLDSRLQKSTQLQISNPKSHFQTTTLKVQVQSCKFKTGLTSPHPPSPRQTQTGCWRQLTHGRRLGFVPTRRGGKFDWLRQGSSWAESLRGNHSIQFKLEKQFVSEAKSFLRQDSQAVLADVPGEGTSF